MQRPHLVSGGDGRFHPFRHLRAVQHAVQRDLVLQQLYHIGADGQFCQLAVAGVFDGNLRHQLALLQQGTQRKVLERPAVQLAGLVEILIRLSRGDGRAHDDAEVVVVAVLGLGDYTATGFIGGAGLDADDGGVVVGAAGVQHLVGGVLPQLVVLVGGAQVHGVVLDDLGKGGIFHGVFAHNGQVISGGIMVLVVQPGRVGKMGAGAAQRLGLVVHHLHKAGDILGHKVLIAAAAHIARQNHGGFIAGLYQRRIQQLPDGQPLSDDQSAQRSVGAVQHILDPQGIGDAGGIQVRHVFQHQDGGHDLGKGGGVHPLGGVFFVQHQTGIQVFQVNGLAGNGKIRLVGQGGAAEQRRRQQQGQQSAKPSAHDKTPP